MDDLIELILEVLFEVGVEASQNKKVPKWIRYILIGILATIFAGIVLVLILVGFTSLKTEPLLGTLFIGLAAFFIAGIYFKFIKGKKKLLNKK